MGVILKEKYINSIVEIKRVFDRIMTMKLGIEGVISAYNPQVGCELEEKEQSGTKQRKWFKVYREDSYGNRLQWPCWRKK